MKAVMLTIGPQKYSAPECIASGICAWSRTKIRCRIDSESYWLQLLSRTVLLFVANLLIVLSAIFWWPQLAHAEQCDQYGSDSEAVILAKRMLRNELTDLQFEAERLEALAARIEPVLHSLRAQFPEVAHVRARSHGNAAAVIKVDSALQEVISAQRAPGGTLENLVTGFEQFDTLNRRVSPMLDQILEALHTLVLCLDSSYDPVRVASAYANVQGVVYAYSDAQVGDGSDIYLAADAGQWLVVVSDRWGDCPSGCLNSHDSFFILDGSAAQKLMPAEAALDSRFEKLLANR